MLRCVAHTMGLRVPFIFQIVLVLLMPLAIAYLISVISLLVESIRTLLKRSSADSKRPEPN
jgi:hypothetical protein